MSRIITAGADWDRSKTQNKIYTALTARIGLERECEAEVQGLRNTMDAGNSLIRNLKIDLSKHLKKLSDGGSEVANFIKTKWMPQRDRSISQIKEIIKIHKIENTDLSKTQFVCKATSATGKVVALVGMGFLPVAAAGVVISGVANIGSAVTSLDRAILIERSIRKAESTLRDDMNTTKRLKNMLSNFSLELSDLEDSIRDMHRATRKGFFARTKMSPNTEKLIKKIESMEKIDSESTCEIMSCISETEWEDQDFFGAACDLFESNEGFKHMLKDSAHIFASGLSLALIMKNGIISSWFAVGLNAFSLFFDFKEIATLILELKGDGTDNLTENLRLKILKKLEEERGLLALGVELSRKKSSYESCLNRMVDLKITESE